MLTYALEFFDRLIFYFIFFVNAVKYRTPMLENTDPNKLKEYCHNTFNLEQQHLLAKTRIIFILFFLRPRDGHLIFYFSFKPL